jgi:DNA-directed RNA polymerase subunit omega
MEGARPLVERRGRSDLEVAIQEVSDGKITLDLSDGTAKEE